jgi:hypothetical protein
MLTRAFVVLVALSPCAYAREPDVLARHPLSYKYPGERGYGFRFEGNVLSMYDVETNAISTEVLPEIFQDCSSSELRCAVSERRIFVAPRAEPVAGTNYRIAGGSLKVLGCIPDTDTICTVAILETNCVEKTGVCRRIQEARMVFIYSKERGVFAFDEANGYPEILGVKGWKLETLGDTAAMYALVGESGIFAD